MPKEKDRISQHEDLIKDLYDDCKKKLGFKRDAKISILSDTKNSDNPLGKTALYIPSQHEVCLYTTGRHIKDILRSLSHELVHHDQNCRGEFTNKSHAGPGYAQEDGHMREMEREAYERGNLIFRDWEDNLKRNKKKRLFTGISSLSEVKMKGSKDKKEKESPKEKTETFFPTDYDIRREARQQTHDALMKRWGYVKKEKK